MTRILGIGAGLLSVMLAQGARAEAVTFRCPATDAKPAIELRFEGEALRITDPAGTATLPASLEGDVAEMFGVSAAGEAEQMVPDLAAMDACLAAELRSTGGDAHDESAVAYGLAGCQGDLAAEAVKQTVDLRVTATVIDPGKAMVFIQRVYRTPSAVTGAVLTLDEFPTRDCAVAAD